MKIEGSNGLVYDDSNPLCWITVERSQGQNFAFIQFVETRWPDQTKRYWGRFDFDTKAADIKEIMETGGKWPDLLPPSKKA
tara:strand:- start:30531 stop:30773 length:243 start_codon:yes stop_codon:yes gene_type:complete